MALLVLPESGSTSSEETRDGRVNEERESEEREYVRRRKQQS
jgi:hypothetical protein